MTGSGASTIGGGIGNSITNSTYSTIGGGFGNQIQANNPVYFEGDSVISGGVDNTIGTNGAYSTIPGGYYNIINACMVSLRASMHQYCMITHLSGVMGLSCKPLPPHPTR